MATVVEGCVVHRQGSGPELACLPAFGDGPRSWQPLTDALSDRFDVTVVELPGVNRAGRLPVDPDLDSVANLVASVLTHAVDAPLAIVGHSVSSAVVVRVAHLLNGQCRSIVSVEGNLTADDAYLTGQAADHNDPVACQSSLVAQVRLLVAAGRAPASYADSLAAADARTLWALGRDVVRLSVDDGLGHEFVQPPCPALYLWSRATTPDATQAFLRGLSGRQHELRIGHHWPWLVYPADVARIISDFVR